MGLTHIYCGNGKGKTTAAMGLAIRAAGVGMKVYIVQLLKGTLTGELESLKLIPNITVSRLTKNFGFTFNMTDNDKKELTAHHNELLQMAINRMNDGMADMLIIDEFFAAYNYGLLDRELAERLFFDKKENCELILTGRNPEEKFLTSADYISEINAVKHPYEKGISARKGIEY